MGLSANSERPRLLCLHGGGSSAAILRIQLCRLQRALGNRFQLVYLDGPLESAPGPGILPVFEGCGPYRCWVSDDIRLSSEEARQQGEAAVRYIRDYIRDHGPFAGILGFSQGARAAASLLIEQQRRPFTHPGLFGAFLCGTFPLFTRDSVKITLPTLHVIGAHDPYKGESALLLGHCSPQSMRKVVGFPGGHHLPTDPEAVQQIGDLISALYKHATERQVARPLLTSVGSARTSGGSTRDRLWLELPDPLTLRQLEVSTGSLVGL